MHPPGGADKRFRERDNAVFNGRGASKLAMQGLDELHPRFSASGSDEPLHQSSTVWHSLTVKSASALTRTEVPLSLRFRAPRPAIGHDAVSMSAEKQGSSLMIETVRSPRRDRQRASLTPPLGGTLDVAGFHPKPRGVPYPPPAGASSTPVLKPRVLRLPLKSILFNFSSEPSTTRSFPSTPFLRWRRS